MAYEPLTKPPETITQGEALSWKVSFADYPPASWTLTYYAAGYGLTAWSKAATTSGSDHLLSLTNANTASYGVGTYDLVAYVNETSVSPVVNRYEVWAGKIKVLPSIASPSSYDARSTAKKILDAIDSALIAFAAGTIKSATIEGTTYTRESIPDLLALRDRARIEYANELAAERIAAGLSSGRKILTRLR